MNNIGKIIFGCVSAVIIVTAIILLIPFGMSAENAKKLTNETFDNLTEKAKTATYLQIEAKDYSLSFYNAKVLGASVDDVVARIDYHKNSSKDETTAEYASGSIIVGKMKVEGSETYKFYVIKTATSGVDGDKKGYKTFDSMESASLYIRNNFNGTELLYNNLNTNMANILLNNNFVKKADDSIYKVTGGSKAISGSASVVIKNDDASYTETLQINNALIKKATIVEKETKDKKETTTTTTYSFKYSGELKMSESLIKDLSAFE